MHAALCRRTEFEGYSADETVRVVMSGNQEPRGVDITEEAYAQGPEVRTLPIPTPAVLACRPARPCPVRLPCTPLSLPPLLRLASSIVWGGTSLQ